MKADSKLVVAIVAATLIFGAVGGELMLAQIRYKDKFDRLAPECRRLWVYEAYRMSKYSAHPVELLQYYTDAYPDYDPKVIAEFIAAAIDPKVIDMRKQGEAMVRECVNAS